MGREGKGWRGQQEGEAAVRTSLSSARWALQKDNGPRPDVGRGFEAAGWQMGSWIVRARTGGGGNGAALSLPVN